MAQPAGDQSSDLDVTFQPGTAAQARHQSRGVVSSDWQWERFNKWDLKRLDHNNDSFYSLDSINAAGSDSG